MPHVPNRTIPPWVRSHENYDNLEDQQTVNTLATPQPVLQSQWAPYMRSAGAPPQKKLSPRQAAEAAEIWREYDNKKFVDDEKTPLPTRPWWHWRNFHILPYIMTNQFVPLMFRFFIIATSIIALALGGSIWHETNKTECARDGSTYLAVILDCLAIPYTAYIAWDEFKSEPIGLRKASSKLKLLLPDLLFIVLEAVNLTLAYQALQSKEFACTSQGTCRRAHGLCNIQKGLVSVLMIALVAWLSTFVVSLSRLMTKMR
ncbi:hypothetical protein EJ08DRAFT_295685 [Tothia fuscella]|uniref:Uncharacterized protein n=1 Tax=Tothia fuscella TaxID=1048955 RepID=A0A9P4P284_9PEZI|nr:hypothetical protein EJ08DRAFT_295685 [Tothia fuscella]